MIDTCSFFLKGSKVYGQFIQPENIWITKDEGPGSYYRAFHFELKVGIFCVFSASARFHKAKYYAIQN